MKHEVQFTHHWIISQKFSKKLESLEVFCQSAVLKKVLKLTRKHQQQSPYLWSCTHRANNFTKKGLHHTCFPLNSSQFFGTLIKYLLPTDAFPTLNHHFITIYLFIYFSLYLTLTFPSLQVHTIGIHLFS